ncbi:MAG: energy coupling factor transporter S component ThiW [Promethearchaeota archaeon]|jgi:energy coupling factor transporter S component ThiW
MSTDESNRIRIFYFNISKSNLTKRVATSAVMVGVGLVLSYLNPFAYFPIFGARINPFAHIVNGIMGVLVGMWFALFTATTIAILRFSLTIGSIHAFHGGMSGAMIVGLIAYLLWKKKPKYVEFAALTEPIGTIFIGGSIAQIIAPLGGLEGLFTWWGLFAASCIPGSIIGFIILLALKKANISREDFFESMIG